MWGADRLIIGLPTGLSGQEGPQAAAVRGFAEQLRPLLGPETTIEFWDERLTTRLADQSFRERGLTRKQADRRRDVTAAQLLLQNYLDAQKRG